MLQVRITAMPMTDPARSRLTRWAAAAFTLDARSLAIYRIGLGLLLFVDSLLRTRDFSLMFTPRGIFPLPAIAEYYGDPTNWSVACWHEAAWWSGLVLAMQGLAFEPGLVALREAGSPIDGHQLEHERCRGDREDGNRPRRPA